MFVALVSVMMAGACSRALERSSLQTPEVNFDPSAMAAPLQCLSQHLWDANEPPFDRLNLKTWTFRVGAIPDRSGKWTGAAPSDNPSDLRTYMQGAMTRNGLFEIKTTGAGGPSGDLPIPPGSVPHAPTNFPATFLVTGGLDGDTDLRSDSADAQLSVGPLQFLLSTRQKYVAQRLYVEIASAREAGVMNRTVWDPYQNVWRRMHLGVSVEVQLPETSLQLGGSYDDPAGNGGGALGADARVDINRPEALQLAIDTAWFELLRRLTNSYEAADACLDDNVRAYVRFPKELYGIEVDPVEVRALVKEEPQPSSSSSEPKSSSNAEQRQEPAPPTERRSPAPPFYKALVNGRHYWEAPTTKLWQVVGGTSGLRAFTDSMSADMRAALDRPRMMSIVNTAMRLMEDLKPENRATLDLGGKTAVIANFALRDEVVDQGLTFCRALSIALQPGDMRASFDVCLDRKAPVWRVNRPSTR